MRRIHLIRRSLRTHLLVKVGAHTQYGLGAKRIDWIRNKVGNNPETIVFPIYDGHGNMIYTLTCEANDGHELGNERIYGAWGDLRIDSNPGDGPNTQYCANLGHKKDNESGLTYMRARYYEPWTGRFMCQDPAKDGWNWFVYCGNNPISRADANGRNWDDDAYYVFGRLLFEIGRSLVAYSYVLLVVTVKAYYELRAAIRLVSGEFALPFEAMVVFAKDGFWSKFALATSTFGVGLLATFVGKMYMALGKDVSEIWPELFDSVLGITDYVRKIAPFLPSKDR